MTFDFTPDWMAQLLGESPMSPVSGPAQTQIPSYPDHAETARLLGELFTEGSLSAHQWRSVRQLPEVRDLLPAGLRRS